MVLLHKRENAVLFRRVQLIKIGLPELVPLMEAVEGETHDGDVKRSKVLNEWDGGEYTNKRG